MKNACTILLSLFFSLKAFADFSIGDKTFSFHVSTSLLPNDAIRTSLISDLESIVQTWTNKTVEVESEGGFDGYIWIAGIASQPIAGEMEIPLDFTQEGQHTFGISVPEEVVSFYQGKCELASQHANALDHIPNFISSFNSRAYTNLPPAQIASVVYAPGATTPAYSNSAQEIVLLLNKATLISPTKFALFIEPAGTYGIPNESLWTLLPYRPTTSSGGLELELHKAVWLDNAWHIALLPE